MTLEAFTDEQLKQELARRGEVRGEEARKHLKHRLVFVKDNILEFLEHFAPEHDTANCNDDHLSNRHNCLRCFLSIANGGMVPPNLDVKLRLVPMKED